MKTRKTMALFMAMSMVASTAVCASAEEGNSEEPVTIVVGSAPDKDANPKAYEEKMEEIERFQELYPYITVELDTYNYSSDTFMAKAAAGQLPDICYVPMTEAKKVGESGYVKEISDKLQELGYLDAYKDEVKEIITDADGKIYSYCFASYKFGLMANKTVLEEAGLLNEDGSFDAPDTWEELGEMAGEIKAKTGKAGLSFPTINNCGGWHFVSIAGSYGVNFETQNEDGSWTASFNTPEAVAALQFVKDLKWKYDALDDNSFIDNSQALTLIGSGQAGFLQGVPNDYNLGEFNNNGMTPDEILIFPIPEGPEGRCALSGGSMEVFPADITDAQLDAAFKWLEFDGLGMSMSDATCDNVKAEYEIKVSKDRTVLPLVVDTCFKSGDGVEKKNTILEELTNVSYDQVAAYAEDTESVLVPEPSIYCQELYAILDGVVQEVITNEDADCEQLIADAANDFQVNYLDLE